MPATSSLPGLKEHYLKAYDEEHQKTLRVLRAFPKDKADLRPHAKSKTARELAFTFVVEQGAIEKALTTGFDWSKPRTWPDPPESWDAIVDALEQGHRKTTGLLEKMPENALAETVQFMVAPKTVGDMTKLQFLWNMLHDQIHHRGQLSVYLRMAEGKVPAIFGPSADEPWR